MTLAQKRMAAMIMEDTSEDVEALRAQQAAAEAEAAAAVGGAGVADGDDAAMEQSDDEDEGAKTREAEERARELERARVIQASSVNTGGPMKIRTDYVPKRKYLSLSFSHFPNYTLATSRSEEGRGNDNVLHLWTANCGRRIGRAHAY